MEVDYLIVGQGLAGSVMALTLLKKGYNIRVIDDQNDQSSSSMVAAGIFNPVTGKEMKKTWMADALFPKLHSFYQEQERLLGARFFYPMEMYRPFLSVQEQNDWIAKSAQPGYDQYIRSISPTSRHGAFVYDEFGGIGLRKSGYLDVKGFLKSTTAYLEQHQMFENGVFDESTLTVQTEGILYRDIAAGKVIYCNGREAMNSKYFDWLPFRPVKGEILLAEFARPLDRIYNRGVFIVPNPDGLSRVGATYDWRNLDTEPGEAGRKELLEKLNKLTPMTFGIKGQIAGVRPATKDRKPFIGVHPLHKPLCIFNGLGTKGVSLAPYFAENFIEFLERKVELAPEVNIFRYF